MSTIENFFGGVRIFGQKNWKGMYFLVMLINREPSSTPFQPPKITSDYFFHSVGVHGIKAKGEREVHFLKLMTKCKDIMQLS